MRDLMNVVRKPHITEKSTRLKEGSQVLCFKVEASATKIDVRRAVERIFEVKVDSVRVVSVKGKMKRSRAGRPGHRADWKKAYVRLKPGSKTIEYFEGI